MLAIRLKERQEEILSELKTTDTFKIPESSFIFMKVDVDGLTIRPVKANEATEAAKPIEVIIPEGKVVVVCLSNGKAQFLNISEKVQIVELEAKEIIREKE